MTFSKVYNETRAATNDRETLVYETRAITPPRFRTDNSVENDGVRRNSIKNNRLRNFVARASLLISFEKRTKPLGWREASANDGRKFSISARSRTESLSEGLTNKNTN